MAWFSNKQSFKLFFGMVEIISVMHFFVGRSLWCLYLLSTSICFVLPTIVSSSSAMSYKSLAPLEVSQKPYLWPCCNWTPCQQTHIWCYSRVLQCKRSCKEKKMSTISFFAPTALAFRHDLIGSICQVHCCIGFRMDFKTIKSMSVFCMKTYTPISSLDYGNRAVIFFYTIRTSNRHALLFKINYFLK